MSRFTNIPIGPLTTIVNFLTVSEVLNLEASEIEGLKYLYRNFPNIDFSRVSNLIKITQGDYSEDFWKNKLHEYIPEVLDYKPSTMSNREFFLTINSLIKKYILREKMKINNSITDLNISDEVYDANFSFYRLSAFMFDHNLPSYLIKSMLTWADKIQTNHNFTYDRTFDGHLMYLNLYFRGDSDLIWWFYNQFEIYPVFLNEMLEPRDINSFQRLKPILDILFKGECYLGLMSLLVDFLIKSDPEYQNYVDMILDHVELDEIFDCMIIDHGQLNLYLQLRKLYDNDFRSK